VLTICLIFSLPNIDKNLLTLNASTYADEENAYNKLHNLRFKNPKKVTLAHLNINSIPRKFVGIMDMIAKNLDIFLVSETKLNHTFPDALFFKEEYSSPYRRDRNISGGGLLMYVNRNIASRLLKNHVTPIDVEIMCVEINLKKQKWLIIGIYRPPSMNAKYFFENLSRVIDLYSNKFERFIIMGDFNLEPHEIIVENFCHSFNLYNLVKENTCYKGLPKCYDLILTNYRHNFQHTEAITTGFSDFHKLTATVLKTEYVREDPIQIEYRDYKHFNSDNFRLDLSKKLNAECNSAKNYNTFQNILRNVLENHAPLKKKRLRANNSPFMSKQLRKMIMNRSRCKNNFFKNKTAENWEKYTRLRNKCVKLTKRVKKEYFENLDINFVSDNKKFWKAIKPHLSNKGITSNKIILVENEEIIRNDKNTAEIFNDYFINVLQDLNIPEISENEISDNSTGTPSAIDEIIYTYRNHPSVLKIKEVVLTTKEFSFEKALPGRLAKEINDLNPKKTTGADSIPAKILKRSIDIVKEPLTQLFNNSIDKSEFPSDMKLANVSPLFKKNDSTMKQNYRPISVLSSISKVFERIMFKQISLFMTNILSPYLCGFRKGFNAQQALLRLFDNLNRSLDKKEKVGMLLMDLSKAFDCIHHKLLIAKMHMYGFDKRSLKHIYSFLSNRKQRVKLNSEFSSWKDILKGVPQGSVLGPLLFNIYLNDIFYFIEKSLICNYADDNSLSVADMSIETIIKSLETDISILNLWFDNNGMVLNASKCQFMVIESSRATRKETAKLKILDETLEEIKCGKLLGVTVDNNITMEKHIKSICKKASNKLYALARMSPFLNKQKRVVLMKAFIISQFNYCPIVWMFCLNKSNSLINRIHERALRIAHNDYLSNFEALLEKDHSVTIHTKNIQQLTLEIYKTLNGLNPRIMDEIFKLKNHAYYNRKCQLTYPNPQTETYGLQSFGFRSCQLWDSLPNEIQNAENINSFISQVYTCCKSICKCNLCQTYLKGVGYINKF